MQIDVNQAWATLQSTGHVSLPGETAGWSNASKWLSAVLIGLIAVLAVGFVIGLPLFFAMNGGLFPGSILGVIGGLAMLVALGLIVRNWRRRGKQHQVVETQPVILEATGLTLRGVGPIPWQDFGMAERRMVPAEHDSGYILRAVMPLTASGFHNVNQLLPPELRDRISPASGPMWNRQYSNIYVSGVSGLKTDEVMWLINSARELFVRS